MSCEPDLTEGCSDTAEKRSVIGQVRATARVKREVQPLRIVVRLAVTIEQEDACRKGNR